MRKQMEEEMEAMRAAAAAEAEAEAAAAAEEEDQDQELDEATQAMADADLNENATESSVELPPAEGAVKDDPNFDAEASAAGLYKVREVARAWQEPFRPARRRSHPLYCTQPCSGHEGLWLRRH